jgi:hypothetical protein
MATIEIRSCAYWVTRLHAVRVAARLRRELNAEVKVVGGPYGQFRVDLDGRTVIEGGALAMLGVLPSAKKVLEAVRAELAKG